MLHGEKMNETKVMNREIVQAQSKVTIHPQRERKHQRDKKALSEGAPSMQSQKKHLTSVVLL